MATDIANKKEIMPELSGHERPTLVVDREAHPPEEHRDSRRNEKSKPP